MNIKSLADQLNVAPNTIRNWIEEYYPFLSSSARPPKGKTRVLTAQDARVLHYIWAARSTGQDPETITEKLEALQGDDWRGLPDVPAEWALDQETIPLSVAAAKAYDVAQIAVLQRDLEHAQQSLERAEKRAESLQIELDALKSEKSASDENIHALELELNTARGEVSELKARLDAYALAYGMGRDKPLPLAVVVGVTALVAVVVVVLVFVVARLLL